MSFDLQKMLESKRALRRQLAGRPVAEKLRMLDALRQRALTLHAASALGPVDTDSHREEPAPYRAKPAGTVPESRAVKAFEQRKDNDEPT